MNRLILILCLFVTMVTLIGSTLSAQTAPPGTRVRRVTEQDLEEPVRPSPAQAIVEQPPPYERPGIATQAIVLSIASILPFIIMILTSFLKIVVVLSLLRSALGVQQAPPNQIINGVALMLSLYVMYPTMLRMYDAAQTTLNEINAPENLFSEQSANYLLAVGSQAQEPLREFLKRNLSVKHQAMYYRMAFRVVPENHREGLNPDSFVILVPAFITSQLKDAFEIGVLIYIPFFVIDLVTSNILLAMGMMMLSPVTISMPLKLFLLVMLDGWTLLIEGLVNTFRQ
ncbi:MAG: SctR family type III secretion system export apparatus subunit CdsR [Chlamydiales bacterium]